MNSTLLRPDRQSQLLDLIDKIQDPALKDSCRWVIDGDRFSRCPGSTGKHHAYAGGLKQHTWEVAYVAFCYSNAIAHIDLDVVLTACIWHDWGKVEEYAFEGDNVARVMPKRAHIEISADRFSQVVNKLGGSVLEMDVVHAIKAHHGRAEWGATELPKTIEAFVVHFADMTSAHSSGIVAKPKDQNKYEPVSDFVHSPGKMVVLPQDAAERKKYPIYSGVLKYFPNALALVARRSWEGGQQHHPGQPIHWDPSKSSDELDALQRHIAEGEWDAVAWRALANCERKVLAGWNPHQK